MDRREFLSKSAAAALASTTYLGTTSGIHAASVPSSKVRVGFVGTAHPHAQGKLEAILELHETFELVGVAEPNAELRKSSKSLPEFQNVRWLEEESLLRADGLQAIIVETDFPSLLPSAARAVENGLHVHLDKPPGKSVAELSEVLQTASQRNVHVQMGYMLRYNPAFELCFRAVREGWLGRIFELNATMSTVRPKVRRKEITEPAGGAMFDLGSHLIDAVVSVLGPPQKVTSFGRALYPEQDDVVDNQLAVLEYADAIATVRTTFVEPNAGERRQFVVCGEKGTLEIRPLEPPRVQLTLLQGAGGFKAGRNDIEMPAKPGRYHAQLLDFAAVVRGEAKPRWSAEHDLTAQQALLAASSMA